MKIKFWGTRGSIPVPGRDTAVYGGNTTCLEITLNSGRTIIIDAGTGIRELGEQISKRGQKVDIHLLITHIHWDHVMGFPFFGPIYDPASKITIDGSPACMKGLSIPFDNNMGDGFFPIKFENLKADIQFLHRITKEPLNVDGTIVDSIPLHHPQGAFGFRFQEDGKKFVFITDNELTGGKDAETRLQGLIDFCKNADILIHDAQYTPVEIKDRQGWGHSDYESAIKLAIKAHVKKIILFHHDPSRKDPEVEFITALCRDFKRGESKDIQIDAAREEDELIL